MFANLTGKLGAVSLFHLIIGLRMMKLTDSRGGTLRTRKRHPQIREQQNRNAIGCSVKRLDTH